MWVICYTLPTNLSYLLHTTDEFELFAAYYCRMWVICCKLLTNLSYFLHTTDEFELFAAYY